MPDTNSIAPDTNSIAAAVSRFLEESCMFSFDDANISADTNLFEAGVLDSYGLIELIMFLESNFKIKLTEDELMSPDLSNLAGICRIVANQLHAT